MSIFSSVLLYDQRLSRYKVGQNRKGTERPQTEIEHLTVKSTLYTLTHVTAYPEAQILVRLAV